jgi:phosphoribosylformylglycinamidine synthase
VRRAQLVLADGEQRRVRRLEQRAGSESGARCDELDHGPARERIIGGVETVASGPYCPAPMKARVVVTLKRSVLDPQGQAVARALASLGFAEVGGVRLGKIIEIDLDEADPRRARERLSAMCEKLLANPVIEEYRIEDVG